VYYETGQYDKCMEDCDLAVERGRELRADFKLIAKAMARKGSALVKLDRWVWHQHSLWRCCRNRHRLASDNLRSSSFPLLWQRHGGGVLCCRHEEATTMLLNPSIQLCCLC
jgi:hypothetical protein